MITPLVSTTQPATSLNAVTKPEVKNTSAFDLASTRNTTKSDSIEAHSTYSKDNSDLVDPAGRGPAYYIQREIAALKRDVEAAKISMDHKERMRGRYAERVSELSKQIDANTDAHQAAKLQEQFDLTNRAYFGYQEAYIYRAQEWQNLKQIADEKLLVLQTKLNALEANTLDRTDKN